MKMDFFLLFHKADRFRKGFIRQMIKEYSR